MARWSKVRARACIGALAAIGIVVHGAGCGGATDGDAGRPGSAGDPASGPFDAAAEIRPDLLEIDPDVAAPGDDIALSFPAETARGIGWVLEEATAEGWQLRYYLTSRREGEAAGPWQWAEVGDEYGWDDVGVGGPGPELLRVPTDADAGKYRVCAGNALEPFCAELEVVET